MHQTTVRREYTGIFRYVTVPIELNLLICRTSEEMPEFFSSYVTRSIPRLLWETELSTRPLSSQCDKIFTSSWLGNSQICAGTKDNQLLLWDLNKKRPDIPISIPLPSGLNPALTSRCGQHALKPNLNASLLGIVEFRSLIF
jgi:hypothetical protein